MREDLKPDRKEFFKNCKTEADYIKAFKAYRAAKKKWLAEINKNKKWEKVQRSKKRKRIYRKYKDSEFRKDQALKKPIKRLDEF